MNARHTHPNCGCGCGYEDALVAEVETLRRALSHALSEIEGSPYKTEPWGWGITYRISEWKSALAGTAKDTT